jgi:riboflavin kinase / FMN adenylyltransferase
VKVYKSLNEFRGIGNAIVTIGTFDGVHVGHQRIINRLREIASEEKGETVILTFFPHPRMVLYPGDNSLKLISTLDEKIMLLEKLGIDHLVVHPFTKEFSRLSAIEFIKEILVDGLRTKKLVIGYNHQFGRNREGTLEQLVELGPSYNFSVEEIPRQDVDHIAVSSTKIREALLKGDTSTANNFLGYDYMLTGKVVNGEKIGRSIDFPTANIEVHDSYKLIPGQGIYAVKVKIDENTYKGMLYIGTRPTLGGNLQKIEVNIFDFNSDIYGKSITILFKERIREDKKLENLAALKQQLLKDKEDAIKLLTKAY